MQYDSSILVHRLYRSHSLFSRILFAMGILAALLTVFYPGGDALAQQVSPDLQYPLELHRAGKLKDAVDAYSEVLEKNPNTVEALNWRGTAYDDLDESDKALADLNKAIQLIPEYADALNNRGEVHRKKKRFREAMSDYRSAANHDRTFAEPHYNIALILEQEKNIQGAIAEYTAYLNLKPNAEDKKEVEAKIEQLRKAGPARPAGPPGERKPPQVAAGAPPAQPQPAAPPEAKPAPKPGPPGPPGAKPGPPPAKGAPPPKKAAAEAPIPGMENLPIPPEALAVLAGAGIFMLIAPLLFYVFFAVMLFFIARKTATPLPWLAFIPIANLFLMVQIAGKPIWWLALMIVLPVAASGVSLLAGLDPTEGIATTALSAVFGLGSIVLYLFICLGMAAARGKSALWGILAFIPCTSPVGYAYLGLSK